MLAIYCRISVDRENQKSIHEQESLGKEFAKENNLKYQTYTDKGISGGGNPNKRPAYTQMIQDINKDEITNIFVWNLDRTAREETTWFDLANLIIEKDITLYENGRLLDLNDENTFFTAGMMSQINALFRRTTSKKIKTVLKRNAQEGKAHAKVLPFGYMKDENGYLQIDEEEAITVKKIYDKSLSGIGSTTIKNWLNENEVPTRYNKLEGTLTTTNKYTGEKKTVEKSSIKWSDKTVQDILRNPIYKGKRKWGKEFYDCPAIFNPEYWKKVNENLPNNKHHSGKNVDHKYLLKGILECGVCGNNYYGRKKLTKERVSKDGKKRYDKDVYICSSKRHSHLNCGNKNILLQEVEDFVWNWFFSERGFLDTIRDEFNDSSNTEKLQSLEKDKVQFIKEEISIQEERGRAINLAVKGLIPEEDIKAELLKLEKRKEDITIKLEQLNNDIHFIQSAESKKEEIKKDIYLLREHTPFNKKKEIIKKYIKRIRLYYKDNNYVMHFILNIPTKMPQINILDGNYQVALYFANLSSFKLKENIPEGLLEQMQTTVFGMEFKN
jgi:DNA invertase Pin-like site-specific DNA recombinase